MVTKFETEGGVVTRGMTYAKMLDHLREARDCAYTLAHLHQTEGNEMDTLLAHGWRGVGEMLALIEAKITDMAMRKMS
jgi:hypothetical protein